MASASHHVLKAQLGIMRHPRDLRYAIVHKSMPLSSSASPMISSPCAFVADAMLGRLARWLRMLGYDTAYEQAITDQALIERALGEGRWVLTRDRYLAKRKLLRGRHTVVRSDYVVDQLRQLVQELKITLAVGSTTASRCPACNGMLESITREEAAPNVPRFVATQQTRFSRCVGCSRIYWPGTHWENFHRQLARAY